MSSQHLPIPKEPVVLLPVFLTILSREGEKSQEESSYVNPPINTHTTQHNMKKDRPVSANHEPHATVTTTGRRCQAHAGKIKKLRQICKFSEVLIPLEATHALFFVNAVSEAIDEMQDWKARKKSELWFCRHLTPSVP
ncbi:hypothetical protein E2C01_017307 [Portunus trituberculatus]|uniref:Uncharacterized protein n=1 Tax=Portunus trituberculatus TaxID=210409 RepID=A0A5B7DS54_PORTR|nr:hypothetical protein [Portunus trituberculatus]